MATNFDKAVYQAPVGVDEIMDADTGDIEVELEGDENESPEAEGVESSQQEFDENIADYLEESELNALAQDLLEEVAADLMSRRDWERTYTDGIKLLGIKPEEVTDPWPGACSLTHPMLTEAVVRFQSETIMETFPAAGPVKVNIIGQETPDKVKAATRVREDLNYQITEVMSEYRPEHEKMLWHLPLTGSAFKKIYFDPSIQRQVSMFVPAEDIILPYGASDLNVTCPRITHRMYKLESEIDKLQQSGFYSDVELSGPSPETNTIQEAKDKESGYDSVDDERYVLYEIHTELDIESYIDPDSDAESQPKPYVVTIEKGSGTVLSIRRNWYEADVLCLPRQHFVHYQYVPGFGAYGFGLIHLIGNYVRGATSFLRQLGDSGTLSNLPGGLKTKGMRVHNENEPISPGEFRDVDVLSGTLRDNVMMLPYKEPSVVVANLLTSIVEDGRRLGGTADLKISDMSAQAPVGTTLAILERMLKVMSAVQARVHYSLKRELRLLAGIIRDFASDEYEYDVEAPQGRKARKTDYELVEIFPVSDPNAATMSQKIIQYQSVMQLAASAPQIYNMQELHKQMLDVIGIKNIGKLIPTEDDMQPVDPISENMAILNGKPVKAFMMQDHEAHIQVHMLAMQDPVIMQMVGQNPKAQQMVGAAHAHITEHVAYAYRQQMEQMMGVQLPPPGQPIPPEQEAQLSRLAVQASQKLLGKHQTEAQAQAAQQAAQDPVLQNETKDLAIKELDTRRKVMKDLVDAVLKKEKLDMEKQRTAGEQFLKGIDTAARKRKGETDDDMKKAKIVTDAMLKNMQIMESRRNKKKDS